MPLLLNLKTMEPQAVSHFFFFFFKLCVAVCKDFTPSPGAGKLRSPHSYNRFLSRGWESDVLLPYPSAWGSNPYIFVTASWVGEMKIYILLPYPMAWNPRSCDFPSESEGNGITGCQPPHFFNCARQFALI